MFYDSNAIANSKGVVSTFPQKWLIFVLFIWLSFSVARQAFDLVGKLWIPVAFNLLQVLSCISGLFAAFQCRVGLLIALSVSTLLSITYNVALLLWYADYFGANLRDESDALSAGLPFGYSFFLRNTPFCDGAAYFNLTAARWRQDERKCFMPYYHLEGVQAVAHVVLALLTLVFSVLNLARRKSILAAKFSAAHGSRSVGAQSPALAYGDLSKSGVQSARRASTKCKRGKSTKNASVRRAPINSSIVIPPSDPFSVVGAAKNTTTGNRSIYDGDLVNSSKRSAKVVINGVEVTPPDSIDDLSSGYMNSSYDSGNVEGRLQVQHQQQLLLRRLKQQNQQNSLYSQHSTMAKSGSTFAPVIESDHKEPRSQNNAKIGGDSPNSADLPERARRIRSLDEYSSAPTVEFGHSQGAQHSASNSASSAAAFEAGLNALALPDPPPPPQISLTNRPNSVTSNYFQLPIEQHSKENNAGDNGNDDDDDGSTSYSEINTSAMQNANEVEGSTMGTFVSHSTHSNRRHGSTGNEINDQRPGVSDAGSAVNRGLGGGPYASSRLYASRNAGSGASGRYYNAKMRSQNQQGSTSRYGANRQSPTPNRQTPNQSQIPPARSRAQTPKNIEESFDGTGLHEHQANNSNGEFSTENSGYLEFMGRENCAPKSLHRTSSTNLTSLISFDPKSNTLIRVREHPNNSDDFEVTASANHQRRNSQHSMHSVQDYGGDMAGDNQYWHQNTNMGNFAEKSDSLNDFKSGFLTFENIHREIGNNIQEFAPVLPAEVRTKLALQHEPLYKTEENQPQTTTIRQKMIPNRQNHAHIPEERKFGAADDRHRAFDVNNGDSSIKTPSPDWAQAGISHPTMMLAPNGTSQREVFETAHEQRRINIRATSNCLQEANKDSNSSDSTSSVQDYCVGGNRPLPSTSFPVDGAKRTVAGICVASAIKLAWDGEDNCDRDNGFGQYGSIGDKLNGTFNEFYKNNIVGTDGNGYHSHLAFNQNGSKFDSVVDGANTSQHVDFAPHWRSIPANDRSDVYNDNRTTSFGSNKLDTLPPPPSAFMPQYGERSTDNPSLAQIPKSSYFPSFNVEKNDVSNYHPIRMA